MHKKRELRAWQNECIETAIKKYLDGQSHFMCLATPGAGKTTAASCIADRLFGLGVIDFVICFSPSVTVAHDFQAELEAQTGLPCDGHIGARGKCLTYHAMLTASPRFWDILRKYRVFVIFDEIHHCSGSEFSNANTWGELIIRRIQGVAKYTLALSGTPWRSDKIPIALARYCQVRGEIHCDYVYGLKEAIRDGVCKVPAITLIDNNKITYNLAGTKSTHSSISDLLKNTDLRYSSVIDSEGFITYCLTIANKKLDEARRISSTAGGLIVTASISHAYKVQVLLRKMTGKNYPVVTCHIDNSHNIIKEFRDGTDKWIISVGMISEGTNIPRLGVCCHLSRIRTEMYFRQVLGRILRINDGFQKHGYFFVPADESMERYADSIACNLPNGVASIKRVSYSEGFDAISGGGKNESSVIALENRKERAADKFIDASIGIESSSPLASNYSATVSFGNKFIQRLVLLK